jgi:hypothetical protein
MTWAMENSIKWILQPFFSDLASFCAIGNNFVLTPVTENQILHYGYNNLSQIHPCDSGIEN